MAEELNWQPIASKDLDREQPPHLRISSAGKCPRALGYAALHTPESNPPGQQAQNRMAMGHMAEVLILKDMERNGWETKYTVLSEEGQLELELEIPGTNETIKGHPDGVCRHEGFTNNYWVTLECKSMSVDKATEVQKDRIVKVYPGYLTQISLYSRRLKELEKVSHGERGIFAMMDREGYILPQERAVWEPEEIDQTLSRLADVVNLAQSGEVMDRPYPQSSTECRYCNYHNECWGTDPDQEAPAGKQTVTSEQKEVVDAARTWRDMKPQVDKARDMLQALSNSNGQADVLVDGIIGGYFQPKSERVYDPEALERAVPADILEKCRINLREKPPAFWVRRERN